MIDLVAEMGPAFLGTRLKRLGERLQASAAEVTAQAGLSIAPAQVATLAALRDGPQPIGLIAERIGVTQPGVTRVVGQLREIGLVEACHDEDQRKRIVQLSPAGQAAMQVLITEVWPRLGLAAQQLYAEAQGDFLSQVGAVEAALASAPLASRAREAMPAGLSLREWDPSLAACFREINAEWIEAMFALEEADRAVLNHPQEAILAPGGAILFVEAAGLGIVGTCALKSDGADGFELTKMGVREAARGQKAGEFLLAAAIERAKQLRARKLYLLTNTKCAAAIHLYEKLGFVHDSAVMAQHGSEYQRCDVAMRYAL